MKKNIICSRIICALIAVNLLVTSVYAKDITLRFNGASQALKVTPMNEGGTVLVGMREIFTVLGATVNWDDATKTVTATRGKDIVKVTANSKQAKVNNKTVELQVAPKIEKGVMLVPLRFVSEAYGATVAWDDPSKTVTVTTSDLSKKADASKDTKLSYLDMSSFNTEKTKKMSYDELIKLAIAANSDLTTITDSIKALEENLVTTRRNYVLMGTMGIAQEGSADMLMAVVKLETQIANTPQNEQIKKDVSEYLALGYLTNIENYKMDIQLSRESFKVEETNLSNLKLKSSLGLISENDLNTAKQNHEITKTNLETLEILLQNEKQALNNLIKKYVDEDIYVDYKAKFEPIKVQEITAVAVSRITDAPTIEIRKRAVEEAKYALDTHIGTLSELKIDRENAYDKASRDLNDAKNALEKTVVSTYNQLRQLEEKQKSFEVALQKAQDSLKSVMASYDVGMVTNYEIDQAKLAILKAEVDLAKNAYSYKLLTYVFEKPYLT